MYVLHIYQYVRTLEGKPLAHCSQVPTCAKCFSKIQLLYLKIKFQINSWDSAKSSEHVTSLVELYAPLDLLHVYHVYSMYTLLYVHAMSG